MSVVSLKSPSEVPPEPIYIASEWYLQYSTRALWREKRNVQLDQSPSQDGSPATTLTFSFQQGSESKILSHEEKEWKILGTGRSGKLEDWMIETEYGIADSSGEVRADFRPMWIAIYFPGNAGVDILCTRRQDLAKETLVEMRAEVARLSRELGKVDIFRISNNNGRDAEVAERRRKETERWEKRTGASAGISPDLIYDDVVEEETPRSKCATQ